MSGDCTAHSSCKWCLFMLLNQGQKEVAKLICCCWLHDLSRLDPRVDTSTIQLMGYQTSREEIGELFHQVCMLQRLPGPPPCGPKWVQEVTRDILSSLKDHLWWRRGDHLEGSGELEPASAHVSQHQDGASQRERQSTSGEQELAEAQGAPLASTSGCFCPGGENREAQLVDY